MSYLAFQISVFLLLAAAVGFAVAWVLRGLRLGARIDTLESELWTLRHGRSSTGGAAQDQELARLRREREACQAELERVRARLSDDGSVAPERGVSRSARAQSAAPASDAAARPPQALDAPSGDVDDLKRIRGIGPRIERILNDLGIYQFSQIAQWTPANVAWVDAHLRFRGRIARERWIEQARQFASSSAR